MQWISQGFVFRHTKSRFHDLDPRVKLLVSIELFILSLLVSSMPKVSIALTGVLIVSFSAKILGRISKSLLYTFMFSIFIFVINLLVGYPPLESLVIASRFLTIVGSTSIFFLTTPPDELELVMKWFRLPRDLVFAFVTAVRFVPVMMLDALQIMDAQKSRGLELQKGNPYSRLRRFIPVLIPLIVDAVIRSGELAEAMESRAYGAVRNPTSIFRLELKQRDYLLSVASIVLSVSTVYMFMFVL